MGHLSQIGILNEVKEREGWPEQFCALCLSVSILCLLFLLQHQLSSLVLFLHYSLIQGETSVESSTIEPVWNEQVTFIEMFPPLVRKIKVQLLDDANIGDVALATHFIDLQQISDPGRNGEFVIDIVLYQTIVLSSIMLSELLFQLSTDLSKVSGNILSSLNPGKVKDRSSKNQLGKQRFCY